MDVNVGVVLLLSSKSTLLDLPSYENVLYCAIREMKQSTAWQGKNVNKAGIS